MGGRDGDSNLTVFRPVPVPNSVTVRGVPVGRSLKARSRMDGSR
jgi:hypothetical protein